MKIQEQKATMELPVLMVDSSGSVMQAAQPGEQQWGRSAVEGTLEYGLTLGCDDSDPSRVTVNVRLLTAHYSLPPGCSPRVLEFVNRMNADLAACLLGETPSHDVSFQPAP